MSDIIPFKPADASGNAVLDIARMLRSAGGSAYLVGGCVRDMAMGVPSHDYDLEVYGIELDVLLALLSSRYQLTCVGSSFGVIKLLHLDIDIALPRTESKVGAGHRGFLVATHTDLPFSEATARRDFTINAIMLDPLDGSVIDPWHGLNDIRAKVLRHTSTHFSEDPLRVLRGMQFAARFQFQVAPETIALCSTLKQEELAMERVATEWEKMLLQGTKPSIGLTFLRDCGWLRYYPELDALTTCPQSPRWHPEGNVWNHTLLATDASVPLRSGNRQDDLTLSLAALCHDFGKPATTFQKQGKIVSPGHAKEGVAATVAFISRLWPRPDLIEQVSLLVKYHMLPASFVSNNVGDAAYRRLALRVKRMDLLHKLSLCDMNAMPPRKFEPHCLDPFIEKAKALSLEDSIPAPIVMGRHLIQLGVSPGIKMKPILAKCFEAQLDGKFNTIEDGISFAKTLLE